MTSNKRGRQSFLLPCPPVITAWACVGGNKEAQGPLGHKLDRSCRDARFGEKTWEQGERRMQQLALETLLSKAGLDPGDMDLVLSGDLLNQCIGSSFALRNTGIPHLGLYGACSTMALSMLTGAMAISGGFVRRAVCMTSSHFASSERQYRFPLGYGGQRTPSAQWTVTGAGAVLLEPAGTGPRIECCTLGTVTDLGITDAGNMGAAMAPAACSTIRAHLSDLGRGPGDYDCIVTGDLGSIGKEMVLQLLRCEGLDLAGILEDCGCLIFDPETQDVHAGGSGCGCSAVTLCAYLLDKLVQGKWKRLLFCGTGALLSPTSTQQGLPIPGVCHAVSIVGGA